MALPFSTHDLNDYLQSLREPVKTHALKRESARTQFYPNNFQVKDMITSWSKICQGRLLEYDGAALIY